MIQKTAFALLQQKHLLLHKISGDLTAIYHPFQATQYET